MQDRRYKSYLLIVLLVILASNYIDRFAFGFLLQDIKVDLGLSDTQLGFMTGIAFAPSQYLAFAMLFVVTIGGAIGNGPIFAATQTLVPPTMRATSIALILLLLQPHRHGVRTAGHGRIERCAASAGGRRIAAIFVIGPVPGLLSHRVACMACQPYGARGGDVGAKG